MGTVRLTVVSTGHSCTRQGHGLPGSGQVLLGVGRWPGGAAAAPRPCGSRFCSLVSAGSEGVQLLFSSAWAWAAARYRTSPWQSFGLQKQTRGLPWKASRLLADAAGGDLLFKPLSVGVEDGGPLGFTVQPEKIAPEAGLAASGAADVDVKGLRCRTAEWRSKSFWITGGGSSGIQRRTRWSRM